MLGRAEAILEKKAKEGMAAEDRTAIAETEGAIAVRRLLVKRNAKEAEAILERIAGEMAQSESAASSSGPEVHGSYLQTVGADPYEDIPVADTVSQYRARVEETMRKQQSERMRVGAVSQNTRLRQYNRFWPHLPAGMAGFGQAEGANGAVAAAGVNPEGSGEPELDAEEEESRELFERIHSTTEQWKRESNREPDDEPESSKRLKTTDEIGAIFEDNWGFCEAEVVDLDKPEVVDLTKPEVDETKRRRVGVADKLVSFAVFPLIGRKLVPVRDLRQVIPGGNKVIPVSYTHLTLPTKRIV